MQQAGGVEGQLTITLDWDGEYVTAVSIASSRPLQMPRIFTGKSVNYLLDTLPLLYSVCGTAQACAAVTACEQAMGICQDPVRSQGRAILVLLETAKEHAWRISYDWARMVGEGESADAVARLMALMGSFRDVIYPELKPFMPGVQPGVTDPARLDALQAELEQTLQASVFTIPLDSWLSIDSPEGLLAWASEAHSVAARFISQLVAGDQVSIGEAPYHALPVLDALTLDSLLMSEGADALIAQPTWEGETYETGPMTRVADHPLLVALRRQYGHGLLVRAVARLVELASIPGDIRRGVDCLANHSGCESTVVVELEQGRGIAQIEAARGRLIHRVELDQESVVSYRILAPTEWNFHPGGVLAQGLAGMHAGSELVMRAQAAMLINAIDPCVAYELVVR